MNNRLIGLAGLAQSGKDTVGGYMEGFHRLAFADALKSVAYDTDVDIATIVDEVGWERAKAEYPHVRPFLQRLGVAMREHVSGDVWVVAALSQMYEGNNYVITDVRFPNEYRAIVHGGGKVWRVERPGIVAPNGHISETALDGYGFDQVVENNGTLDDLRVQVQELLNVPV